MSKYVITNICKTVRGKTACRIRALRSFSDVSAGDLGGYIESENCLSHDGLCWVYPDAVVLDNAKVYDDARMEKGLLYGNGRLYENGVMRWSGQQGGCFGYGTFGARSIGS